MPEDWRAEYEARRAAEQPRALESLRHAAGCSNASPWELLARHAQGDWGDLSEGDRQANSQTLQDGSRILSAFQTKTGRRLWVITEADRSSTCLLLPDEY
jgi:hypothetical protein